MKYLFLIALLFITTSTHAAFAPNTGGVGFGSNNTLTGSVGGGGDSNTLTGSVGGGNDVNTLTGTVGGGDSSNNTLQGTVGGSGQTGVVPSANIEKPTLSIAGIMTWIIKIINYMIYILWALAVLFFLYGVFILMFVGGTNEESRSKGKKFMFWGIVSLFVMVTVWGLVNILKTSVFGGGSSLIGPQFKI